MPPVFVSSSFELLAESDSVLVLRIPGCEPAQAVLAKICITSILVEHEHALVHCSRNCKRKTGVLLECLLQLGYRLILYLLMYTNEETVR